MVKNRTFQSWARRIHIYTSMALLLVVLFFALTGITQNRSEHFVSKVDVTEQTVVVPETFLFNQGAVQVDKEGLVTFFRQSKNLKGFASEIDVYTEIHQGEMEFGEVTMSFKSPGYDAVVFIDMEAREATVKQRDHGFIALLNDLHKGRNTGLIWHLFIDVTALLMTLFALTGLILVVPKRRTFSLAMKWMALGSGVAVGLYWVAIP